MQRNFHCNLVQALSCEVHARPSSLGGERWPRAVTRVVSSARKDYGKNATGEAAFSCCQ
jgi:hypothetical protein